MQIIVGPFVLFVGHCTIFPFWFTASDFPFGISNFSYYIFVNRGNILYHIHTILAMNGANRRLDIMILYMVFKRQRENNNSLQFAWIKKRKLWFYQMKSLTFRDFFIFFKSRQIYDFKKKVIFFWYRLSRFKIRNILILLWTIHNYWIRKSHLRSDFW